MQGIGEWVFRHSHTDRRTPSGYVRLTYQVAHERDPVPGEDACTARCPSCPCRPAGGLAGSTAACRDAVLVSLHSAEEDGDIDEYLHDLGVKPAEEPPEPFITEASDYPVQDAGGYREPIERVLVAR